MSDHTHATMLEFLILFSHLPLVVAGETEKRNNFIMKNILMWQLSRKKLLYGFHGSSIFFLNKEFGTVD